MYPFLSSLLDNSPHLVRCLDIGAWDLATAIGGCVPDAVVTFESGQEALGVWQEVKGEAMSVNQALYASVIEGTVRLDGS